MFTWIKELFGIGLKVEETVKTELPKVVEVAKKEISADLQKVEAEVTAAISAAVATEEKVKKVVKEKVKKAAGKVKKNAKK